MTKSGKLAKPAEPDWIVDCRDHLGAYYLGINPGWRYVRYQQEIIIPAVEALERGDFNRLMIFISPGHAKTEIATKSLIPWYFGKPRNYRKNVILITRAADLCLAFGGHIRDVMQGDTYHRVFPNVRIQNATRAKHYFKTTQGQEFMAFGTDGGITGNRADMVVMEDWIGNMQEAQSEDIQRHLYEDIYKAVVKDRLRPQGKMLFIMTRWGTRDVAARILDDEAERWKVLVIPAQEHAEGCADDDTCVCPYLWESHFGRDFYEEFKLGDRQLWQAKWQQSPRPLLNQGFLEVWLRFWLPATAKPMYRDDPSGGPPMLVGLPTDYRKLYKFNAYIFVDPAMGKEAAHDRTSAWVIVAGPEGRLFVVDGILDRLGPLERIAALVRLCRKWKPKAVYYEEYAMTSDSVFLEEALKADNLAALPGMDGGTIVTSIGRKAQHFSGGRLKKHDRIMQLVPDFKNGRIWLPLKLEYQQIDGNKIDIISYFINREYLPYAGDESIAHDDCLDCLSRVRDPDVFFDHMERQDDEYDEDYGEGGGSGSWESRYRCQRRDVYRLEVSHLWRNQRPQPVL